MDEFSYILEGEIGARIGDEVLQATTGSYVFKPRGLPHAFWNATAKPARLLELISPAGFEKYFAELADLLRVGGGVDQITNLAEKYGLTLRMDWVPELCAKFKLKLVSQSRTGSTISLIDLVMTRGWQINGGRLLIHMHTSEPRARGDHARDRSDG